VQLAQQEYPSHTFVDRMPTESGFDTAVALAVIEHVGNAAEFLGALSERLGATGRVIVTTPHPRFEWIHTAGAAVGVFSTEADDEHEDLLDETTLGEAGHQAGIHLELYQRFLFGANQLAVYRKG
jgi:2-polyprenyl-3-methyl-5-hydroxy-6-metoxy-1,4-benzoquinol methylase